MKKKATFSREQLSKSKTFGYGADLVKAVLEEIIAVPTENNFVAFEIKSVGPIAVTKKYAGVGASLVAKIKNTRTPFSIDIGVGDVIVPRQEKRKIHPLSWLKS